MYIAHVEPVAQVGNFEPWVAMKWTPLPGKFFSHFANTSIQILEFLF